MSLKKSIEHSSLFLRVISFSLKMGILDTLRVERDNSLDLEESNSLVAQIVI